MVVQLERDCLQGESPGETLQRLGGRLPRLEGMLASLSEYPAHLLRAVRMLLTILTARSQQPTQTRARQSGIHPALSADLFAPVLQRRRG